MGHGGSFGVAASEGEPERLGGLAQDIVFLTQFAICFLPIVVRDNITNGSRWPVFASISELLFRQVHTSVSELVLESGQILVESPSKCGILARVRHSLFESQLIYLLEISLVLGSLAKIRWVPFGSY